MGNMPPGQDSGAGEFGVGQCRYGRTEHLVGLDGIAGSDQDLLAGWDLPRRPATSGLGLNQEITPRDGVDDPRRVAKVAAQATVVSEPSVTPLVLDLV